MIESYPGEIAAWYDDSYNDEKVMMLGRRCVGASGYPMEYGSLPQNSKEKVRRLFEMELRLGENEEG